MSSIWEFLTRTRGKNKLHVTDMITYLYMGLSVIILFGPVLWLVLSSFKTSADTGRWLCRSISPSKKNRFRGSDGRSIQP